MSLKKYQATTLSESSLISDLRRSLPIFQRLTFQSSLHLFRKSSLVELEPLQPLYNEGSKDHIAYVVLYGKLVLVNSEDGVLGVLGPGESVGEEAVLCEEFSAR